MWKGVCLCVGMAVVNIMVHPKRRYPTGKHTHHVDGQDVETLALAPNEIEGDGAAVRR